MSVAERFKKIRLEVGLKQDDFGNKLGLGRGATSAMERGVQSISQQTQENLIHVFNVSINWLLTGEGEMYEKPGDSGLLNAVSIYLESQDNNIERLTDENAATRAQVEQLECQLEEQREKNELQENAIRELQTQLATLQDAPRAKRDPKRQHPDPETQDLKRAVQLAAGMLHSFHKDLIAFKCLNNVNNPADIRIMEEEKLSVIAQLCK